MMEFKTLDYDEIDLFLTSRSMKKLRKQCDEDEKRLKSSTGGVSTLLGNILSKYEDKKGARQRYVQLRSKNSFVLLVLNAVVETLSITTRLKLRAPWSTFYVAKYSPIPCSRNSKNVTRGEASRHRRTYEQRRDGQTMIIRWRCTLS